MWAIDTAREKALRYHSLCSWYRPSRHEVKDAPSSPSPSCSSSTSSSLLEIEWLTLHRNVALQLSPLLLIHRHGGRRSIEVWPLSSGQRCQWSTIPSSTEVTRVGWYRPPGQSNLIDSSSSSSTSNATISSIPITSHGRNDTKDASILDRLAGALGHSTIEFINQLSKNGLPWHIHSRAAEVLVWQRGLTKKSHPLLTYQDLPMTDAFVLDGGLWLLVGQHAASNPQLLLWSPRILTSDTSDKSDTSSEQEISIGSVIWTQEFSKGWIIACHSTVIEWQLNGTEKCLYRMMDGQRCDLVYPQQAMGYDGRPNETRISLLPLTSWRSAIRTCDNELALYFDDLLFIYSLKAFAEIIHGDHPYTVHRVVTFAQPASIQVPPMRGVVAIHSIGRYWLRTHGIGSYNKLEQRICHLHDYDGQWLRLWEDMIAVNTLPNDPHGRFTMAWCTPVLPRVGSSMTSSDKEMIWTLHAYTATSVATSTGRQENNNNNHISLVWEWNGVRGRDVTVQWLNINTIGVTLKRSTTISGANALPVILMFDVLKDPTDGPLHQLEVIFPSLIWHFPPPPPMNGSYCF
jgi:hypothetical protein